MNFRFAVFAYVVAVILLSSHGMVTAQNRNWTSFRGGNLNGVAMADNIPLIWNDLSFKWKTEIHDKGFSSPVVYGNQIWITTAKADGKELYAVCVDFNTGEIIYDILVFTPDEVDRKHSLNTYASPTPCVENGFVYVHYGSFGTACINTSDGSIVWKTNEYKCRHVQGPASSPILYKNLLILHFDGTDVRYIVALNKSTGKLVWRSDRPVEPFKAITEIGRKAYLTPIIINAKGRDMLISNSSVACFAYNPDNGKEIWRVLGGAESTIAMPFTEDGILYWYTGYMVDSEGNSYTEMLAVNPDGEGDITNKNIIWKRRDDLTTNQMLTPVIKNGHIYTVTTKNMMMCIDAKNGKELWSAHVTSNYNSSPLYINGNIWFFSVRGEVVVLKEGPDYEIISKSQMDSGIWATPAIVRNTAIVRTEKYLYKIGM